jgi:xanthine dehydrogenase YagR molybdenum-binding subunit
VLPQIAAEEIGVPLRAVSVRLGEAGRGLYAPTSAGSMTLSSLGPAIRSAASDARRQLLDVAATMLDANPSDLTIEDGQILVRDRRERHAIGELAERVGELDIVGRGVRGPNRSDLRIRTFAAQFVQVAVDLVTGRVRVERVASVHDIGRVINPMTAESQVIGGIIQGIGFATMEQQMRDGPTGRVLNPNLEEYKMPTALDAPEIIARFVDRPDDAANSIGAKGLGEPPIVGIAAAVANAVAAATGVRIRELPLSPPAVLAALSRRTT